MALINQYALPWAKNIIFALVIFIIGRYVAKAVQKLIMRLVKRSTQDEMLINFIASIVGAILLLFVIIAALSQLGIDTTSLIALIGAAGLAIGLSLQDSLKNFAAGVMILVFKPFVKGDYVEVTGGKEAGTVEDISIFTMTMKTLDNKEIIVPNGAILLAPIINYSKHETRRVDMVFSISYDDDIRQAKTLMADILTQHNLVLQDPAPVVAVAALADSSINFNVRPWCKTADYWTIYSDVHQQVKEAFDAAGITIPYPQVQMHQERPSTKPSTKPNENPSAD
ncbi:mechanosensitive ion channel [Cardiobacteriales bacterium ML27]|uniref:Small-conductance mechanosensitive channel n=2 Tax=Ostreibacterium oceani TaxID=2654998 RepID=A0A6N7EUA8_9GAMM|nr:mechanosensitive ion channel [Ostreibacterium oceani]